MLKTMNLAVMAAVAALAASQAWAGAMDSRAPELKMPDLAQSRLRLAVLSQNAAQASSAGNAVVLPAPKKLELKTKLTQEELFQFIALAKRLYAKKGADGKLQPLTGLHSFKIKGDVLPSGAFRLKGIELFHQKHFYLTPCVLHTISIDADGTIRSIASSNEFPSANVSSVEDPVAQKIIKREIAFWTKYAEKRDIWGDGLLHGDSFGG